MTDSEFWEVIALFDWGKSGDDDAVLEPARIALAGMSVDKIYAFDDRLSEKLHSLDTRAHCKACYDGELDPDNDDDYISPDDFLYSRCVVVANGRKLYDAALADPTKMPQGIEFESILYLAESAFEQKTGGDYDHVTAVDHESFQNADGWQPTNTEIG